MATPNDLPEMQKLYVDTIQSVCNADYTPEQIGVWTSSVANTARWEKILREQMVVLAEKNNKIIGYGTLLDDQYIDLFYVHKDHQRQGIAYRILSQIESQAQRAGTRKIWSEVSITAKPFFEKSGFKVLAQQHNLLRGVELINFRMEKTM